MKMRKLGNTGVDLSALGFGCMRLPEYEKDGKWFVDQDKTNEMIHRAVELGVNYFDTAYYYCHSNSEKAVGEALKGMRKDVKISTKIPLDKEVQKASDYRKLLEESLTRLGTDCVDFYHFWAINKRVFDDKIMGMKLYEEAIKAKEEGLIKHISFSFHDDPIHMKHIIDHAPFMETVLCQYNLLDRANEDMITYAANQGLGVIVMGPVGGGRLAAPAGFVEKLTGNPSIATYELAFKYVLSNPHVSCALSGMETTQMVEKNALVASQGALTNDEVEKVNRLMVELKKFSDLYCTGCHYCNVCPQKIDIARIFSEYTLYNVYGQTETAIKRYQEYLKTTDHPPMDCTQCGLCKQKCPQKLDIPKLLTMVHETLK